MSIKSTILSLQVAFAVALVGACSGDHDQDPAEVERGPEAEVERGPEADQAPATAPATAPASGQPDVYGRQPGDPHYGHDHP